MRQNARKPPKMKLQRVTKCYRITMPLAVGFPANSALERQSF